MFFFQFSDVALFASIPKRDLVLNGDKFLEPVKNSKKKIVENYLKFQTKTGVQI